MNNQEVQTLRSEYRLAAVGALALVVAIITVIQLHYVLKDIDRIAEQQRTQQDILLKNIREHIGDTP